jgi:glutathione peroxidase
MQKINFRSKRMKKYVMLLALAILIITSVTIALTWDGGDPLKEGETMAEKSVLDFTMKSIDGDDVKLDSYSGKVLLLVNVASKCGYTPQYRGLESVYKKYKEQGLVVMGFPANNFLWQEPGTNEEIKTFCTTKYNVTFPMFAKISVKGDKIHPLYKFLTSKQTNPEFAGAISWNFNKFLVDRAGKVVARFSSKDEPENEKVVQAIEQALKK